MRKRIMYDLKCNKCGDGITLINRPNTKTALCSYCTKKNPKHTQEEYNILYTI